MRREPAAAAAEEVSSLASTQRLASRLAASYREHVNSGDFESDYHQRHPKPKALLWAGLALLPLLPVGLALIGSYLVKTRAIRRGLGLERLIAESGQVLLTCPLGFDDGSSGPTRTPVPGVVLGSFDQRNSPEQLQSIAAKLLARSQPAAQRGPGSVPVLDGSHHDQRRRAVSPKFAGAQSVFLFDVMADPGDLRTIDRMLTTAKEAQAIPCVVTGVESGHTRVLPSSAVGPAMTIRAPQAAAPRTRAAGNASSPVEGQLRWIQIGKTATSDGSFLAFDPCSYYPDPHPPADAEGLLLLDGQPGPATIAVKCRSAGTNVEMVASVRLLFSDTEPTSREKVGSVAVDSGRMAIGPFSDLLASWQVGGPLSRSAIVPSLRRIPRMSAGPGDRMSPRARVAASAAEALEAAGFELEAGKRSYHFSHELRRDEVDRCNALIRRSGITDVTAHNTMFGGESDERLVKAAGILEDAGFPIEVSSIQYFFVAPLNDDDIGRANQILRQAKIPASVSTTKHQTLAELEAQIRQTGFARLPSEGKPFVVAFPSGLANASYSWFRLLNGRTLIGYRCDMTEGA